MLYVIYTDDVAWPCNNMLKHFLKLSMILGHITGAAKFRLVTLQLWAYETDLSV